jgi:hypothetical protein
MNNSLPITRPTGSLEKLLSALSFALSLLITARLWLIVVSRQSMWLFPGLYFLEVVVLPGLVVISTFRAALPRTRVACIAAGALTAFSILGAWTVGLFYAPLVILLLATVLASRSATHENLLTCVAFFIGSILLQGLAMLSLVQLLIR